MSYVITAPLTFSGIQDVLITESGRFAFIALANGVEVVELINTGRVVASGVLPSAPTSIAADWTSAPGKLYIGTASSGIFVMEYPRARSGVFTDELVQTFTTSTTPPLSSNVINALDATSDWLLVGTNSGVDFFQGDNYSTRSMVSGSNNVGLTSSGGGYWTTASGMYSGSLEVNYDLIATTGTGVIPVDFEYSVISVPSLPAGPPLDISIVGSVDQYLSVAVATSGGVFIVEESPGSEFLARHKVMLPSSFLPIGDGVRSVDFVSTATFDSGLLNVATPDYLLVFDLGTSEVSDIHGQSGGTRGQSVSSGVISIVRSAI